MTCVDPSGPCTALVEEGRCHDLRLPWVTLGETISPSWSTTGRGGIAILGTRVCRCHLPPLPLSINTWPSSGIIMAWTFTTCLHFAMPPQARTASVLGLWVPFPRRLVVGANLANTLSSGFVLCEALVWCWWPVNCGGYRNRYRESAKMKRQRTMSQMKKQEKKLQQET